MVTVVSAAARAAKAPMATMMNCMLLVLKRTRAARPLLFWRMSVMFFLDVDFNGSITTEVLRWSLVDSCNAIDARTFDRGLARNDCTGSVREWEEGWIVTIKKTRWVVLMGFVHEEHNITRAAWVGVLQLSQPPATLLSRFTTNLFHFPTCARTNRVCLL
jgi:hypothetical protein